MAVKNDKGTVNAMNPLKSKEIDKYVITVVADREQLVESPIPEKTATEKTDTKEKVILPFQKDKEYYVEPLGEIPKKRVYSFFKRLFDIVVSACALIVLAIPMAIVALIVRLSSPGPVFYRQERLGLNGKKFYVVKYRSMYVDAEKRGVQWSNGDDDPRIVPKLRWIRKCRVDELPQLWACFTGKMSLIGPRPERECFYDEFETYIHGFRERLKVKPGLTGLAQVNGGYDLKPEEKIVYDVDYIKRRSIFLDIKILLKTVAVVFSHEGAK